MSSQASSRTPARGLEVVYKRIAWSEFLPRLRWSQGEHTLGIAGTGQGKTVLWAAIAHQRTYNLVLGTKIKDPSYDEFLRQGFRRVQSIKDIKPWDKKVMLWPSYRTTIDEFRARQRSAFTEAFDWVAAVGGWTVWNDELLYMCRQLGLADKCAWFLTQGRSSGLTFVNGSQRPAWIPLESYNGSTHAFLANSNEEGDAKRLADLGLVNSRELMANLRRLHRYEFVYVNTREHTQPVVTKVERG